MGCDDGAPPRTDAGFEPPVILEVEAPSPAVQGSILVVRGLGLETTGSSPRLRVESGGSLVDTLPSVMDFEEGRLFFSLTAGAVSTLGSGTHSVTLTVQGDVDSDPYVTELTVATTLPIVLADVPQGEVHFNDAAMLTGDGFITATEGELVARWVGTFSPDTGGSTPVDVELPVVPLERTDRSRGLVVLTTDLGQLAEGTFDGTVQLRSTLTSGDSTESGEVDVTMHFNSPDLFSLSPTEASLGQVLFINGAGFLGGSDRPNETTVLELQGTFTPAGGGEPEPFGPVELVPRFESGNVVQLVIDAEVRRDELVSALFGHGRGTFMGQATPVAISGTVELPGPTVPFGFVLGPVRQVVYVRLLPGFYSSLSRFGLQNARAEVEQVVAERMQGIYAGWNVDLRFEEPDDFSRTAYSILEIGGPDPNGVGLFGYDNTPGKDIQNLRLFDLIGGTNAETQQDGYPGYGGVFVESFLFWSEDPGLPVDRPLGAPDPEPLFDEIFGPVRQQAATRAEVAGEGDPERVAQVRQAISALGSIVGETASHELGHSLGMAQPYGSPNVFHNDSDGDGCLMDSGGDRPLAERMALAGEAPTTFCYDHPEYLDEILGL